MELDDNQSVIKNEYDINAGRGITNLRLSYDAPIKKNVPYEVEKSSGEQDVRHSLDNIRYVSKIYMD